MADIEEVYVRDLFKKYKGRPEYKGLFSIGKKINRDNGEIYNEGFALDEENLRILKARIEAMLLDEIKPKRGKGLGPDKPIQTKLL
ncbi:hypothetical protein [Candidatus Nitrosocosmicus sp. T]